MSADDHTSDISRLQLSTTSSHAPAVVAVDLVVAVVVDFAVVCADSRCVSYHAELR